MNASVGSTKFGLSAARWSAYPAYRHSGVEWLGDVPEGWEVGRLRRTVAEAQNGSWGDESGGEDDPICIRVADFDRHGLRVVAAPTTRRSYSAREYTRYRLLPGDLLLEKSGGGEKQPVGAVVEFDGDYSATCSNFIARVRRTPGQSGRFLAYLHATVYAGRLNIPAVKQNTGIQNLDQDAYFQTPVPLPPLPEQRAIAAFLDRETAKIDTLVAKKERLLELLDEKRTALISRAVTKGLDPDVPMKDSGVAWLGEVPEGWEVVPLMRLTEAGRPIMYGIVLPGPNVADGVPIVKGGDVGRGLLNPETLNRTTFEIEAGYERSRLRGGDLVFAIRGSIGEVATVPPELTGANLTQDAARISIGSGVHGAWLLRALSARPLFAQLDAGASGATIRGINIKDLKRVRVPLPPLPEQHAIAAYLDRKTARIDALKAKIQKAIDLLKEYRTALISAAVTGKIDVRGEVAGPAD